MELLVFYLFALSAVLAALTVVLQKRAVYSALALIVCFGSIAVLFYQMGAHFIAAIQVIVYAGAIMVLFLFVIMLLDPESEIFGPSRLHRISLFGVPLAALFAFLLLGAFPRIRLFAQTGQATASSGGADNTSQVARQLFQDYLLPFEVTSILILVAVLGAVVLAKRPE